MSAASDGSQSTLDLGGSYGPAISRDGRFVAFSSDAPDLIAADTNEFDDVFVHDRVTGEIERVSVSSSEGQGDGPSYAASLSDDGHIEFCVEHGAVNGYDDGYYHPDIVVTRGQMAVYVARAFGLS